ncbi:MAG: SCO family protein [Rhodobacteraceae bacterium]|nr:SCO family protein [Paracoccaceae bacterium]
MNRRTMIIGAVMVLGMLTVLALYIPGIRPEPMQVRAVEGEAAIGGPFNLIDQNGAAVSDLDFRGKYMLVFFGFTHCPDVCPLTLRMIADAYAIGGPMLENVVPIFISVDPERDTPEIMGEYVMNFDPRIVALTGSADAIKQAANGYRVFYRRAAKAEGDTGDDYMMEHSGYVYFMGPDGRYITHFSPKTTAQELAARVRQETSYTNR